MPPGYLPPLRAVDAKEKVTGPEGVRVSYPLDVPTAVSPDPGQSARPAPAKRRP
jgi:hypothetical protein